jgi:hypothetical protein
VRPEIIDDAYQNFKIEFFRGRVLRINQQLVTLIENLSKLSAGQPAHVRGLQNWSFCSNPILKILDYMRFIAYSRNLSWA